MGAALFIASLNFRASVLLSIVFALGVAHFIFDCQPVCSAVPAPG